MDNWFFPPADFECQRCAQLGIQNVFDKEISTESSNLIVQRFVFDPPMPPYLSPCPTCRTLCKGYRGKIRPSRIFSDDLALADANSLLRNSLWTCERDPQEVSQYIPRPKSSLQHVDTFGKGFADSTGGTVRSVHKTPDYAALSAWLKYCHTRHWSCRIGYYPCLKNIFLIDVCNESLVSYPDESKNLVHYLALSYVWGPGDNYRVNGPCPIAIERLPQTIQDSIAVTRELEVPYLWVDAVCIDQGDEHKKDEQMSYMTSIYRGALATIVAVDSENRHSGLSRVRPESQRSHQRRIEFGNGNILVQKFPSLEEQLAVSPWMRRDWTYQEALLSQRLVLFTKHQVYYSCNRMYCCGAFDDKQAFGSNTQPISSYAYGEDNQVPRTDLHFPTRQELRENRMVEYERLVNLYLKRQLSDPKDILVAFSGWLQRLQQLGFSTGFWNGLPRKNFPRSLLWELRDSTSYGCLSCYTNPPLTTRRKCPPFPTWSWTGWYLTSGVHFPRRVDEDAKDEERNTILRNNVDLRPPLRIEAATGQALFDSLQYSRRMWQHRMKYRHHGGPAPGRSFRRGVDAPKTLDSIDDSTVQSGTGDDAKLKIRGIILELPCHFVIKKGECDDCCQKQTTIMPELGWSMLGKHKYLAPKSRWVFDGLCDRFEVKGKKTKKQKFLLLECYLSTPYSIPLKFDIVFNLLILHWEDGNAIRGGTLTITLRANDLQAFLRDARPQLDDIWLA